MQSFKENLVIRTHLFRRQIVRWALIELDGILRLRLKNLKDKKYRKKIHQLKESQDKKQTIVNFFLLALIRRPSFAHHLWSIFQSSLHMLQITFSS